MSWNDDRIAVLKKLWAEGLSAQVIADRLNCGFTRNAVIGKAHRLGLAERAKNPMVRKKRSPNGAQKRWNGHAEFDAAGNPPKPRATMARPPARGRKKADKPWIRLLDEPNRPMTGEAVPPKLPHKKLLDLEPGDCRFPYHDIQKEPERFHFCGHPAEPGLPYCTAHSAIAYAPPKAATGGVMVFKGHPGTVSVKPSPAKADTDKESV